MLSRSGNIQRTQRLRMSVCVAIMACLAGCQTSVRIPDSRPPVETDPVMPIAGYGMELRLWDLDVASWRRARTNAELADLFQQWQSFQAEQADKQDDNEHPDDEQPVGEQASADGQVLGPPLDDEAQPATFEAFVREHSEALPERPGRKAFRQYASLRGAINPNSEQVWSRNGIEFALVPISELSALRTAMGDPVVLERTWWGSTTAWSRMLSTQWRRVRRLETDLGPLELGVGRFGLVGRAWAAPGISETVLRLDLCPQFSPQARRTQGLEARLASRLRPTGAPNDARAEGALFARLLLEAAIPRGYALIIAAAPSVNETQELGPTVDSSWLGEALLSRTGPDGRQKPLALVIVPVLPEWFALDGG